MGESLLEFVQQFLISRTTEVVLCILNLAQRESPLWRSPAAIDSSGTGSETKLHFLMRESYLTILMIGGALSKGSFLASRTSEREDSLPFELQTFFQGAPSSST